MPTENFIATGVSVGVKIPKGKANILIKTPATGGVGTVQIERALDGLAGTYLPYSQDASGAGQETGLIRPIDHIEYRLTLVQLCRIYGGVIECRPHSNRGGIDDELVFIQRHLRVDQRMMHRWHVIKTCI